MRLLHDGCRFFSESCMHWHAEFCIQQSVLAFHIPKKQMYILLSISLGNKKGESNRGRIHLGTCSYQYVVLVAAFSKADCPSISDGCYTSALLKYIGATQE